jgi:glycosyltransferase involved in cell wall biosynthesis
MRVLMTSDAVGGVWTYAVQLCELLTGRGHQVLLATMGPEPSAAQRLEASAIRGLTLRTSSYALEWMPAAWSDVDRAGGWLQRLAREFGPDVVHLNGYAHASLEWSAPVLLVAHSCVYSWWHAVRNGPPGEEWREYRRRVRLGLAAANAVVAPSRTMGEALRQFYGCRGDVTIVANARSAAQWTPQPKQPFVFAAGRVWDPAKNLARLDEAASRLEWPVHLAGDTVAPDGSNVTMQHARCLGRMARETVAEWMARASIYAFPARYEPFGLSVLEAALSGCALVLGDIASLRENWTGAARFVDPGSTEELHLVLAQLIANAGEREALATAARRRAQTFSPESHVDAYERLYSGMVSVHGGIADTARSL